MQRLVWQTTTLGLVTCGVWFSISGCDSGLSTQTATVTSVDAQRLCIAPEDREQPAECLEVGTDSEVERLQVGDCVKVVSTTSGVVDSAKRLDRACRDRPAGS